MLAPAPLYVTPCATMFPALPVTLPVSSTTTTCISSNLELLSAAYPDVAGFSARDFQKIVWFSSPRVCVLYQSCAVFPCLSESPLPIPDLTMKSVLAKETEAATSMMTAVVESPSVVNPITVPS